MKVLVGVGSWGIGHATRCMPVIRKLLSSGDDVIIASTGRALDLMKHNLGDSCKYYDIPYYPSPYTKSNLHTFKCAALFPRLLQMSLKEHNVAERIVRKEKIDSVLSDACYGMWSSSAKSFLLLHQLRYMMPGRFKPGEIFTEKAGHLYHKKYAGVVIPDFEHDGLSGDLSHNLIFNKDVVHHYVGPITDLKKRDVKQDIDYFISISGNEPQRTIFERKLLSQLDDIEGRIVIACGKPEERSAHNLGKNISLKKFMTRVEVEDVMNRSKMIISRSGYTTLMEVAALGKKAFFVPTPGQTEQEYLSKYHQELGTFHSNIQEKFSLSQDVKIARKFSGYKMSHNPEVSTQKVVDLLKS